MKITIITVAYNNAKTIEDTILSVINQTFKDIEYLIIDGESTDRTIKIVDSYKENITTFISEPDKGIYDAMNKGISNATGDVIGFLNADDVYESKYVLEQIVSVFKDPTIEACYGDLVYTESDNINHIIRYWQSCEYSEGLFKKGWAPAHPTFFAKKSLYEKYGGFDLDYKLAADYELMLRFLGNYNAKSKYIPKVLVKMRAGGVTNKNVTNIIKQNLEIYRAGKKNNIKISILNLIRAKILQRLTQFYKRPVDEY